ncbi:hypothetical protein [Haloarcula nitratireducens]|uniref:Uncharacterized protein n=1 Tax=Haloarcula nitratireducens TaxID=2487749 RepID=A0AAW4PJQ1_9EURY|nr:hypothetical protein [Halomicroarcula nitratireducens]MBX0298189.1 hypothetical protein [Halomicroarcula nitratireducens]
MVSRLDYQLGLLADTIQQAVIDGSLDPADAHHLRERLQDVDSLAEAHEVWDDLEEEYDLLESPICSDS